MTSDTPLKIAYGKDRMDFSLPAEMVLQVLQARDTGPKDTERLLSESFDAPIGKDKLEDAVMNKKKVLIVVPDITRSAHLKKILPYVLTRLNKTKVLIDIIIATGLHKKHDDAQLKELLGEEVVKNFNVLSHEQGAGNLLNFGYTKTNVPIVLDKALKEHDFIVSIGVIEPHLYAGYSGGVKTVAIGLAGAATISATHSIAFLDNPLTAIGSIDNNPFQDTLREIAKKAEVDYCINVINGCAGEPVKIVSGDTEEVFRSGVEFSKSIFEVEAAQATDIVICGIGHPKDINLYQASRAINYVVNVDRPVLKKGGILIIAAELKDGIGESASEKRFYQSLEGMRSPAEFIMNAKKEGCVVGEHRAYMVAKALIDYNIIIVSPGRKDFMTGLPVQYFSGIEDAVKYAIGKMGSGAKAHIIPKALSTIARLKKR